ncbi:MAG: hypothetical protein TYPL_2420 [Candidatus Tyloplasma litorale]|nr:MAG: hypothetical protein TYPL_2420 [Mycoplasmatales bacterium]
MAIWNIKEKRKYRILSIDGGGMKGIFTAYALWRLEEEYNIKIIDYFDFIVGTSTGALISAGILSGISGKEIYETYVSKNNQIFSNKKSFKKQFTSTFFAAYPEDGLMDYLKKEIGDHSLLSLYKLSNKKDFAFFASNFTKAKPIIYSSPTYNKSSLTKNNVSLIEALRTTTAAPFYFEPLKNNEGHLILDGGLWANNPSLAALNLAISTKKLNLEDIEILSFGQSFTTDLDFTFLKGAEMLRKPMKNQFVQLLMSVLALNQNSQTSLVKNLLEDKVYRYAPEVLQEGVSVDKVDTKFLNYTKVYWQKNKKTLVEFIKTGVNKRYN